MDVTPNGIPTRFVESPVDRWPGGVYLPEYLTMPQVMAWEKAVREFRARSVNLDVAEENDERVGSADIDSIVVAGIVPCVVSWKLQGLPEKITKDNFPGAPRRDSVELIRWLMAEIGRIYAGAQEIPK